MTTYQGNFSHVFNAPSEPDKLSTFGEAITQNDGNTVQGNKASNRSDSANPNSLALALALPLFIKKILK